MGWVCEIFAKRWDSYFSHKKGGVGNIGGCFKKRGYHLFLHELLPVLSFFECLEELSLLASNQQINFWYQWIIQPM